MASIIVPASIEELGAIQDFLHTQLPQQYHPALLHVELAVEELLVNIVSYAYDEGSGIIELDCQMMDLEGSPYLYVCIKDTGKAFNPFEHILQPDLRIPLEQRPQGGLGIFFVTQVVSKYHYSRRDAYNITELYFALGA